MYERSHVKVKVKPCSTARLSPTLYGEIKHRVYAKGKRESLPSEQVFHLLIVYCYSNYTKIDRFTPILSITIVLNCFYQLISRFENLSTWISRLPFAVNAMLNDLSKTNANDSVFTGETVRLNQT